MLRRRCPTPHGVPPVPNAPRRAVLSSPRTADQGRRRRRRGQARGGGGEGSAGEECSNGGDEGSRGEDVVRSYLLPHLHSGWAVIIRFGHYWDETCMQDELKDAVQLGVRVLNFGQGAGLVKLGETMEFRRLVEDTDY